VVNILILLALRSLYAHKLRSLLSVLGVVCGVMAVLSMISIGEGAKQKALQEIEALGLKNIYINRVALSPAEQQEAVARHVYGLSWLDIHYLEQMPDYIEQVAALRELNLQLFAAAGRVTPKIVQASPNYAGLSGLNIGSGRFLLPSDESDNRQVCVLGFDLADQLAEEGKIGSRLRVGDTLFQVVGILAEQSLREESPGTITPDNFNQVLFVPFSSQERKVQPGLAGPSAALSRILVSTQSAETVSSAHKLIERTLTITHNGVKDYQLVVPRELLQQSIRTQRLFNTVLAVIGGISLLVGGIGIMNIMLATVSERRHEIGLRRAVGATKKNILYQFLIEAVLLTGLGGIAGIGCGVAIILIFQEVSGWPISVTAEAMGIPFFLAIVTGVLSGLYPAIEAARMDPIEALRMT
jgi:putative ABC transport system permease protein